MIAPRGRSARLATVVLIVAFVIGVAAASGVWWLVGRSRQDQNSEQSRLLRLNRVALAATENLESETAAESWSLLSVSLPGDRSIAVNAAINRLLAIDTLAEIATDATSSPEEKRAARSKLPDAISLARSAIETYKSTGADMILTSWMQSRVTLREASLLPRSMTKSIRRELFDGSVRFIGSIPDQDVPPRLELLAGPLIEVVELLEDPVAGVPSDLVQPAAASLAKLSSLRPSNLFLAMRAAQLSIAAKQPIASELVRRTQDLATAIQPILERQTAPIGKTPDQLVEEIVASIDSNDFKRAESGMLIWFNLLNATELIKTDRRRVSPHPLDLLSFGSLRMLSTLAVANDPIRQSTDTLSFQTVRMDRVENAGNIVAMIAIDADLDLDDDLLVLERSSGERSTLRLASNDSTWSWTSELSIPGDWTTMIAADFFVVDSSSPERLRQDSEATRHNTIRSVLVVGPSGAATVVVDGRVDAPEKRLVLSEQETGLEDLKEVTAVVTGDFEGDGDLDLMFAAGGEIDVRVNRGNRTFFAVPREAVFANTQAADDPIVGLAIADLDRDLDLDVVAVHRRSGRVSWVENLLHLRFRHSWLDDVPSLAGADSIAIEDLDGNVSWDLVVGGSGAAMAIYSQTSASGQWRVESTSVIEDGSDMNSPVQCVVCDWDNDSFMESTCASSTLLNWPGGDSSAIAGWSGSIRVASDFNGDRRIDVAGLASDGAVQIGINETRNLGESVAVRFKGIDDNNANSGRVNHYAIGSVLELRYGPHIRSRIVTQPVTHFGVDGVAEEADMRVIFPNGLTQSIPQVEIGTLVEEEQTLKGSCPYLYAFNGERFEFVTDCLWAAPLGLQVAPGVVVPDRPWEHLLVDGKYIEPRDGGIELRITEELWEVAYFDLLQLSAVDHPESIVVLTNEKVGPGSIATPKIHAFDRDDLRPATVATDSLSRDVTKLLSGVDGEHVRGFEGRFRQGLCPPHFIELDLRDRIDEIADADQIHLVLTGWILPTDTSLNIQIDQNPDLPSPEPPSLWVPDSKSAMRWRVADPFIGFPGGKNKTIVVDLSKTMLRDDPRIRVQTSAEIYWDAAALSVRSDAEAARAESQVVVTELPLLSAIVALHGFSRRVKPGPDQAEVTVYDDSDSRPRWPPLAGGLTNFGPVDRLLDAWDDRMVVIAGGDEIQLRFATIEPVTAGSRRDYVLHGVGWDKDADLNTLEGQSSLPLPFREMGAYPWGLDQSEAASRVAELNAASLKRTQDFRAFWRRGNVQGE